MTVPRYYEDLKVLHDGTMPPRAYYIPASKRMDCLAERREKSDRIRFLNGNWKFRYYPSIYDVEERFFEPGYDTCGFEELAVPGVWQAAGHGCHTHAGIKEPFPLEPPSVPRENPCGAYVHRFEYQRASQAPMAYLNFEGVGSCFYVWLNGAYIGYSQVSHATSEFDVTSALEEGWNTLAVLVLKWCDGSYLENQDGFCMSGIFRDVYLLNRPRHCVGDYRVTTAVGKDRAKVRLYISYIGEQVGTAVSVYDMQDHIVATGEVQSNYVTLEIQEPDLWNAEKPQLYMLVIETAQEVITDCIGFRTVRVKKKEVYLNGQKIRFHGVEYHGLDPVTGFPVCAEQMQKDLAVLKQHNFNTICSSHYPNAPYFYQLCDKYGFMAIGVAEVEAHGVGWDDGEGDTEDGLFQEWDQKIGDGPIWRASILDRIQSMVLRDKNRPCIMMWSMGGGRTCGRNFERALWWLRAFDSERVTQYESAGYGDIHALYGHSQPFLYSDRFPSFEELGERPQKDGDVPVLLEEYKKRYCPVRVVSFDRETKELKLRNGLDFTDLNKYAAIRYEVNCSGSCIQSGRIPVVSVPPHGEASIKLDVEIPASGRVSLKLVYQFLRESPMIPAGHVLGFDEIFPDPARDA